MSTEIVHGPPLGEPPECTLFADFAAFQAEVSDPEKTRTATIEPKDKSKPSYSYSYADLSAVLQHVRPLLAEHGFSIAQDVTTDDQHVHVKTLLMHKSGERLLFGPLSLPSGGEPKNWGSAATYARRFALMAALGIAADGDDDARAAGRGATRGRPSRATDRQLTKIAAEAERAQVPDEELSQVLERRYKVETTSELSTQQASDLIDRLMAAADRRGRTAAAGIDPNTGEVAGEPPGMDAAAAREAWAHEQDEARDDGRL